MKLTLHSKPYKLNLKHPFTISRSTRTSQETIAVSISNGKYSGYGEAIPYPYYGITLDTINESLSSCQNIVSNAFGKHPNKLWSELETVLKRDYFTLCAINCAYWDFYAKSQNRTTRSFFYSNIQTTPLSSYTIGIDSIEVMKQKMQETPWPIYKIKLGTDKDVEIVSELRKVTDAIFRIDANCAWTVQETIHNAFELKKLGVEFIEQPLNTNDWSGMKTLKEHSVLPLVADESCQRYEDVEKCAETFHGINIKLMKCGGLTPALKMIEKARELNLKVMLGCMAESTVGISNLCQIASLVDYIDADGAMLIKNDTATGIELEKGIIKYPQKMGSGIELL